MRSPLQPSPRSPRPPSRPLRACPALAGLLALALALFACTSSDDDRSEPTPDIVASDTATDDLRADDTATDPGDTTADTDPDTPVGTDADPDVTTPSADFVLGTNTVYQNLPEHFFVLEDGAQMPVTFGSQAAWMVVLAFKTRGLFEGELRIAATIDIEDERFGELELVGQKTMLYPDNYAYYFNFWLVINTPGQPEQGKPATVTMTVEDAAGHRVTEVRQVTIGAATN